MTFRQVCSAQAVSAIVAGAFLLAAPKIVLHGIGVAPGSAATLLVMVLGGILYALGATLYGIRDVALERGARRRIAEGNAICDGLVAVLLGIAAAAGAVHPVAGVVLGVLFAANCASWLTTLRE